MKKIFSLANILAIISVLAIFFIMFTIIEAWKINTIVQTIISMIFALSFGFIIFSSNKETQDCKNNTSE